MKILNSILMTIALITVTGCMNTSNRGGTAPVDEEFSITVPSSITIKQGEELIMTVSLKRGDDFKRDVQLNLKANGISLIPANILVKASDKAEVQIKISVAKTAAIGDYPVSVKGTPTIGKSASTACIVKVVAP